MRTGFDAKRRRSHYTPDSSRDSIHLQFEFVASIGLVSPIGRQREHPLMARAKSVSTVRGSARASLAVSPAPCGHSRSVQGTSLRLFAKN